MTCTIGIDLGGIEPARRRRSATASRRRSRITRRPSASRAIRQTIVERVARGRASALAGGATGVTVGVGIAAMLRDRRGTVANSPHLRWRDVAVRRAARDAARRALRGRRLQRRQRDRVRRGRRRRGARLPRRARRLRRHRHRRRPDRRRRSSSRARATAPARSATSRSAGTTTPRRARAAAAAASRPTSAAATSRARIARRARGGRAVARRRRSPAGLENVNPGHVDHAAAEGDEWALGLWTELAPLLAVDARQRGRGAQPRAPRPRRRPARPHARRSTSSSRRRCMVAAPAPSLEPLTIVPAELGDDAGLVGAAHLARTGVSIVS